MAQFSLCFCWVRNNMIVLMQNMGFFSTLYLPYFGPIFSACFCWVGHSILVNQVESSNLFYLLWCRVWALCYPIRSTLPWPNLLRLRVCVFLLSEAQYIGQSGIVQQLLWLLWCRVWDFCYIILPLLWCTQLSLCFCEWGTVCCSILWSCMPTWTSVNEVLTSCSVCLWTHFRQILWWSCLTFLPFPWNRLFMQAAVAIVKDVWWNQVFYREWQRFFSCQASPCKLVNLFDTSERL